MEISYRIDFLLKKLNGHQLNCWVNDIIIWQGSKSECSDWFFLGRDSQYETDLNINGLKLLIVLFSKAGKFKICNQTYKKKPWLTFYGAFNMDEEAQYSLSEFYYPEGVETSDVKTETGIRESQEAIDDL